MQGVNIEKVVWLLLTMFNSSDGDGCDRITHINGKECKSASDLHKNFYDYTLRKIQSKNESIEEMIKRIVYKELN